MLRSVQAVSSGPSVFPSAMPSAAGTDGAVAIPTANAPSMTPGQQTNPHRSNAATAIPAGSQSSVTIVPNPGSIIPSRPAAK